jgi:RNA polymerase sigma factor (sigma-70 family)
MEADFEARVRGAARMLDLYVRASCPPHLDPDEVFQDTVVRAWSVFERYDRGRAFGPWLRGIARRVLSEHLARRSRTEAREERIRQELEARFRALELSDGRKVGDVELALRRCLQALAPKARSALSARYEDGLRGSPLARRLEVTTENARKIVQRARQALLACLERARNREASHE